MTPPSHIDRPRRSAAAILHAVETGAFADTLLGQARQEFDSRDSAFITELVYGTLRNRERIDRALNQFSKKTIDRTDAWTRNILRLGAYQLLFLDRVPVSAAVNTAVELARFHGCVPAYVNGLLRNLDRNRGSITLPGEPVSRLSVFYSHPRWLVARWAARFGMERTEAVLRENNRPAPLVIRANTLKNTRDELSARLEAEGATVRQTAYSPSGLELVASPGFAALPAFRDGRFLVQDEAAQLIGMMLAPVCGETVLDACAAPGGKATHLAELMNNTGTVIALEKDPVRIEKVRENCARLGITSIRPVQGDATAYREGVFDKALVDAPCSGLGVLRRHPDGRWTKEEKGIREKQALQRKILENCSRLVKPGGALVYATCTTEPEENEAVVDELLENHREFAIDDPRPYLPAAASELIDKAGIFRTFPQAPGLDGFFGVRLVKR